VRSALAKVPGVEAEDVVIDYQAKTATVKPSGRPAPSPEQLIAAFEGTRFKATVQ
jgi:hypothetical protein